MEFSFIQVADIHLGRLFSGLSEFSYDDDSEKIYIRSIKKVMDNIIGIAEEKNVDFVFIAGDTFDSSEQDFSSKLILKDYLKKLSDLGIKIFLICGNHDPLPSYNKNTFNYDSNSQVKIVGLNTENNCELSLYNKGNELVGILHALSFTNDKFLKNPTEFFNKPTSENQKLFHIGLLHCDLDGSKESSYAPCTRNDLINLNYNYWALGHIHVPSKNNDIIQYSGTIQGRNTKETDEHGIRYVKVKNNDIIENIFIPTDIIRFQDLEIDISTAEDLTSAVALIEEKIEILMRQKSVEVYLLKLRLIGNVEFYPEINDKFIAVLTDRIKTVFYNSVYISKIENAAYPKADYSVLSEDEGIAGEIYKTLSDNNILSETLSDTFQKYQNLLYEFNFNDEESAAFKQEIETEVKRTGISICSSLYNTKEDE